MREESSGRDLKGALGGRWPAAVLAALVSLIAFWATAAPGTVLQESNYDLTVAAVDLGCAHSPGYPLHTLATHPAVALLAENPAFATNLLSGLFGALAVFFLTLALIEIGLAAHGKVKPWLAGLAALIFGLSRTFWTQASLTDVYTQHIFLLAAALYVALRARRIAVGGGKAVRETAATGLLTGLLLVSHNAGYSYLPALVLILWPALKRMKAAGWGLTIAALGLGLSTYLYLPIRASTGPIINWASPDTLYGFTRSLSQAVYADTPLVRSLGRLWGQIAWIGRTWWMELAPGAVLLGIAGLFTLASKGKRQIFVGALLLWLSPAVLLLAIRNYPVAQLLQSGEAFLITGAFVFAIGLFLGINWFFERLKRPGRPAALGALALILAVTAFFSLPQSDLSEKSGMAELGADLFASSPPRAILAVSIVQGDSGYFDALVRRYAGDRRPDLDVASAYQVGEPWYQREMADRTGLLPPRGEVQQQMWRSVGESAPNARLARSFVDTSILQYYSQSARRPLVLAVNLDYFYTNTLALRNDRGGFVPLGLVEVWRPLEASIASGNPNLGRLTLTRSRWELLRFKPRPAGPHKYERAATDFILARLGVFAEAAATAGFSPQAAAAAVRAGWSSILYPQRWLLAKSVAETWSGLARNKIPDTFLVSRCLFYGLYGRAAEYARRRLEEGLAGEPDIYALYLESLILGDEEGAARFEGVLRAITAVTP